MRKAVSVFLVLAAVSALAALHWHGLAHGLGLDTQQSPFYNFHSGPGPEFVALLGYSSLLASVLHHLNCHESGCWRIGRHHVGGQVWCRLHHHLALPGVTDSDRLDRIIVLLEETRDRL